MRQGIFAIPASGGALTGQVLNQVVAFGKQLALPFPQYATGGDVSFIWWDKDVTGTSNIVASEGKGMWRYTRQRQALPAGLVARRRTPVLRHRGHGHRVHDDPRVRPTGRPLPVRRVPVERRLIAAARSRELVSQP